MAWVLCAEACCQAVGVSNELRRLSPRPAPSDLLMPASALFLVCVLSIAGPRATVASKKATTHEKLATLCTCMPHLLWSHRSARGDERARVTSPTRKAECVGKRAQKK